MSNQLTSQDINQLLEALTIWEHEPQNKAFQSSMFKSVIVAATTNSGEAMDKVREEGDRNMRKAEQDGQLRREQSIMLQAKLLEMRNEVLKVEFVEHATNN